MDKIRLLAEQRHFFSAELQLSEFGLVLLVGDRAAVERVLQVVNEHDEHDLGELPYP